MLVEIVVTRKSNTIRNFPCTVLQCPVVLSSLKASLSYTTLSTLKHFFLPCQTGGVIASELEMIVSLSVCCDWVICDLCLSVAIRKPVLAGSSSGLVMCTLIRYLGFMGNFSPLFSWMFHHDCLDTCCFDCLICMCFVFLYSHLFSAVENVSHGKAIYKYAHYYYYILCMVPRY